MNRPYNVENTVIKLQSNTILLCFQEKENLSYLTHSEIPFIYHQQKVHSYDLHLKSTTTEGLFWKYDVIHDLVLELVNGKRRINLLDVIVKNSKWSHDSSEILLSNNFHARGKVGFSLNLPFAFRTSYINDVSKNIEL